MSLSPEPQGTPSFTSFAGSTIQSVLVDLKRENQPFVMSQSYNPEAALFLSAGINMEGPTMHQCQQQEAKTED